MNNIAIDKVELELALCKKFGTSATVVDYTAERLHGGTIGNVYRMTGSALCEGEAMPFCVVYKTQKKWERYADPLSWRRTAKNL